jgi:predicted nicotinamide N-methyase
VVAELRWGVDADIDAVVAELPGRIDYVLAADCVYNEAAVGTLLDTIRKLLERRGKRTTKVLVCNEYRSDTVHAAFLEQFGAAGLGPLKKEKEGSMHPEYKHELIHVFKLKLKGGC